MVEISKYVAFPRLQIAGRPTHLVHQPGAEIRHKRAMPFAALRRADAMFVILGEKCSREEIGGETVAFSRAQRGDRNPSIFRMKVFPLTSRAVKDWALKFPALRFRSQQKMPN
jgi:hypothetical protein